MGKKPQKTGPVTKKKNEFQHDPDVPRVQKLANGKYVRVLWEHKSYHVKVGSPEFVEKMKLLGSAKTQESELRRAGFDDQTLLALTLESAAADPNQNMESQENE